MKPLTNTTWIGADEFQKVQLAFQAHDIHAPSPDLDHNGESCHGAYVGNILNQYHASLTEKEALCLITYGLMHTYSYLEQQAKSKWHLVLAETVYDYDGLWGGAAE